MEERGRQTCPHSAPVEADMTDRPTQRESSRLTQYYITNGVKQLSKVRSVVAADPTPS